jgi:DNA-binding helix-hairpin-helix protein with protein kinase domain
MIAAPPVDPMAMEGHVSIAWPQDRLLATENGQACVGYVMPRVHKARPIFEFYNPKARLQLCPLFHYGYLLRTAHNLAAAVRAIHERGYVIGDLNESNVLVTNTALVTIVDTDSFQVTASGRVHRCPVGKPEYTPPELQKTRFAEHDRLPEHDAFGLAVLIFQLLMQGVHPFSGRYTGVGEPAKLERRIRDGHWPYTTKRTHAYSPNPHAPPFFVLPPSVQELMRACFEDGSQHPKARPSAVAWQEGLRIAEEGLKHCPNNSQHVYHKSLNLCPWCEIAKRQKRELFPSPQEVQRVAALPKPSRTTKLGSDGAGARNTDPILDALPVNAPLPPLAMPLPLPPPKQRRRGNSIQSVRSSVNQHAGTIWLMLTVLVLGALIGALVWKVTNPEPIPPRSPGLDPFRRTMPTDPADDMPGLPDPPENPTLRPIEPDPQVSLPVGRATSSLAAFRTPDPLYEPPALDGSRPLAGTVWKGFDSMGKAVTFRFLRDGTLDYTTPSGTFQNGTWKQTGGKVYIEMNQRYAEYTGVIRNTRINGEAKNVTGLRWTWNVQRE